MIINIKEHTKKQTYLILGGTGLIGQIIRRTILINGHNLIYTGTKEYSLINKNEYMQWDANNNELFKLIKETNPTTVIYLAGLSNISLCERNPEIAEHLNYRTLIELTRYINDQTKIVYASTDRVFDNQNGIFDPISINTPKTVYGKTKLLAENYLKKNTTNHLIIRFGKLIPNKFKVTELPDKIYNNLYLFPVTEKYIKKSIETALNNNTKGTLFLMPDQNISYKDFYLMLRPSLKKDILKKATNLTEDNILQNSSILAIPSYLDYKISDFSWSALNNS